MAREYRHGSFAVVGVLLADLDNDLGPQSAGLAIDHETRLDLGIGFKKLRTLIE